MDKDLTLAAPKSDGYSDTWDGTMEMKGRKFPIGLLVSTLYLDQRAQNVSDGATSETARRLIRYHAPH